MKYLIVSHKNCPDGFGASWAAHRKLEQPENEVQYIYIEPSKWDLVKGSRNIDKIFFFDVVPDPNMILATIAVEGTDMPSIEIWDHHISNKKQYDDVDFGEHDVKVHFDMEHSGAWLAWNRLSDEIGVPAPKLIQYVQDRDLWKWELPNSRAISAYIASHTRTFGRWDTIHEILEGTDKVAQASLIAAGDGILRYQEQLIDICVKTMYSDIIIDELFGGHTVGVANCSTVTLVSEVAGSIAKEKDIGLCWFVDNGPKGVIIKVSLRSRGEGPDVSVLAKKYGGGGHKNAAGFSLDPKSDLAAHITRIIQE